MAPEVAIRIDRDSEVAPYDQVKDQLSALIDSGALSNPCSRQVPTSIAPPMSSVCCRMMMATAATTKLP